MLKRIIYHSFLLLARCREFDAYLLRMCKQHPIISSAVIGLVFILFLVGANSDDVKPHELVVSAVPFEKTDNQKVL